VTSQACMMITATSKCVAAPLYKGIDVTEIYSNSDTYI